MERYGWLRDIPELRGLDAKDRPGFWRDAVSESRTGRHVLLFTALLIAFAVCATLVRQLLWSGSEIVFCVLEVAAVMAMVQLYDRLSVVPRTRAWLRQFPPVPEKKDLATRLADEGRDHSAL